MKEIREMFNISYFDKEELSLEKHCDTYFEIENDILDVLRKYDIDFVLAETEAVKDLQKQNTELKEDNFKLQARSDRVINNWNKLKEWLKEVQINGIDIDEWTIIEIRNKIGEIEKGGINE